MPTVKSVFARFTSRVASSCSFGIGRDCFFWTVPTTLGQDFTLFFLLPLSTQIELNGGSARRGK